MKIYYLEEVQQIQSHFRALMDKILNHNKTIFQILLLQMNNSYHHWARYRLICIHSVNLNSPKGSLTCATWSKLRIRVFPSFQHQCSKTNPSTAIFLVICPHYFRQQNWKNKVIFKSIFFLTVTILLKTLSYSNIHRRNKKLMKFQVSCHYKSQTTAWGWKQMKCQTWTKIQCHKKMIRIKIWKHLKVLLSISSINLYRIQLKTIWRGCLVSAKSCQLHLDLV